MCYHEVKINQASILFQLVLALISKHFVSYVDLNPYAPPPPPPPSPQNKHKNHSLKHQTLLMQNHFLCQDAHHFGSNEIDVETYVDI